MLLKRRDGTTVHIDELLGPPTVIKDENGELLFLDPNAPRSDVPIEHMLALARELAEDSVEVFLAEFFRRRALLREAIASLGGLGALDSNPDAQH